MKKSIFTFELNGEEVLGFDTGLPSRDFARSKMAQSVLEPGYIIYPDGNAGIWKSGGVTPLGSGADETVVVWGPLFPGEIFAELIKSDNKDEALYALRFWLKARIVLEGKLAKADNATFRGSSGALIINKENDLFPFGTVFFPPADLLKPFIEAEAEWVHPNLENADEISFCTGAMLYRIFCGAPAFTGTGINEIQQNICEGNFLPPSLALPALDPEMSKLISRSIGREKAKGVLTKRPAPNEIMEFIGAPASASIPRRVSSWLRILDDNETAKINAEKARYIKRNALTVKTRRFVTRNNVIITTSIVVLAIIAFIVRDVIKNRSGDITKGMSPVEVAMTYYNAFGELDHTLMENCVRGKAGKEDIDLAVNFFVITRMRQAYEIYSDSFIPVQKWLDEGSPATDKVVFGITDLRISGFSMNEENARLTAEYVIWMPNYDGEDSVPTIVSNSCKDELDFALVRGAWRIESIKRELQLARSP